jgi:hypothetical protein
MESEAYPTDISYVDTTSCLGCMYTLNRYLIDIAKKMQFFVPTSLSGSPRFRAPSAIKHFSVQECIRHTFSTAARPDLVESFIEAKSCKGAAVNGRLTYCRRSHTLNGPSPRPP